MTSISITALKGKTIREILELIHQAESLPENHSPQNRESFIKAQSVTGSGSHESTIPLYPSSNTGDTKNQTAQELLEEIENEI